MKRLIALFLIMGVGISNAQLVATRYNFNPTIPVWEWYVTNSPGSAIGTSRVVFNMQDSSWARFFIDGIGVTGLKNTVDNGVPDGILWTNSSGDFRRSPISSVPLTSGQVTTGLGFTPYNSTNPSGYITQAQARSAISLTTTGTSGAATYNNSTGVLNVPQYATVLNPTVTSIASGARNFNTAYQVSATNPSEIKVTVRITAALSLAGGTDGEVYLEYSANGTSGWTHAGLIPTSNTGTLTIGLNTQQKGGGMVSVWLPVGYYWRLRTNDIAGSPVYAFTGGTQTVF